MSVTEYDFNQTRNEIIQRALRICGVLSLGESVSSEQYNQATTALNALVKDWQNEHIFLWTLRQFTTAVTSVSTSLSALDPAIISIDKAWIVPTTGAVKPLEIITWREYFNIPNRSDVGEPIQICLDDRISPTLYVYPVPTASTNIGYLAVAKLKDFDSAAQNPDSTVRFLNAMTYGLACALADEYGLPMSEREKIETKYNRHFASAKRADREKGDYEFVTSAFPVRR